MDYRQFYLTDVLSHIAPEQIFHFSEQYPHVSFDTDGLSVRDLPVVMLVALTATGKSTTLTHLIRDERLQGVEVNSIPARRDLANMIIIPMAQVLLNEPVRPVADRVERFRYTGVFAEHVTGGFAEVFTWLKWRDAVPSAIVSEGIRGHDEIAYALANTRWHIVELTAQPLTRLQRLSGRDDAFDTAAASDTLSFLPALQRDAIKAAIVAGEISPKAIGIVQAEAQNYGLEPYPQQHAHYTQIATDDTLPEAVAAQVAIILMNVAHQQT